VSKYLKFIEDKEANPTGKTKVYTVWNKKEEILGEVSWHRGWRKYCYFNYNDLSRNDTYYDSNCLTEIIKFLNKLNKEHKENK